MAGESYRTRVKVFDRHAELIITDDRVVFRWASGSITQLQLVEIRTVDFYPDYGKTMFRKGHPVVRLATIAEREGVLGYVIESANARQIASRIEQAMFG